MSPEPTGGFKENAEDLNTAAEVQVDLKPAEQAVIDVLEGDSVCTWHVGCDVEDCYGPRAAAIVAKLRPLIAAETLEQFADKVERGPWYLHVTATARADAAALRTTTPEKEN